MDLAAGAVHRSGWISPRLRADLRWRLARRRGNFAMRVVDVMVQRGGVALDIGASWGLFSNRLCRLVGPSGSVHAFEPHPGQLAELQRLAARIPKLHVHPVALSEQPGEATLHVPTTGSRLLDEMATISPPAAHGWEVGETHPVPMRRLDDVLPGVVPSFVKCDVEGHELAVMEGGRQVLAGRPPLLMEIEQRHQDRPIDEVFARLQAFGYGIFPARPTGLVALGDFDVDTDQTAYTRDQASTGGAESPGYVNDFLLLPEGEQPPETLLAPRR